MSVEKYEHLKSTNIIRPTIYPPHIGMIFYAQEQEHFQIRFTHVSVPFEGKEEGHKHDFAEIFVFVPCNEDLSKYDAETWLYLGVEGDKMIIDKTMAVYIPPGLHHCPIVHKRVGQPFFFVNCPITGKYSAVIGGQTLSIPVAPKETPKSC